MFEPRSPNFTLTINASEILAKCMFNAGIRARVGKLSMDISTRPTYIESSSGASIEAAQAFVDHCAQYGRQPSLQAKEKALIEPVLTPRFVPTCSDSLLQGLAGLSSEQNLHIQSHLAEGREQAEWVKSTRNKDDIQVFRDMGLLTPRTLQAHCTFLTPPDLDLLSETGTSVAHCPLSNIYFSSKPFPLREAIRAGVKVGLGTDVAGGYSLDIMNAMRNAVSVSRLRESERAEEARSRGSDDKGANPSASLAITWIESLYLATRGGALALGGQWNDLGQFAVGVPFDAQQSTSANYDHITFMHAHDATL